MSFQKIGIALCSLGCAFWLSPFAHAGTLTVVVGGGALGEGQIKAIVEPFEKQTGNTVVTIKDQVSLAQLKLAEESDAEKIDVMSVSEANGIAGSRGGYLREIDYKSHDAADLAAIDGGAKKPWGIEHFYYANVIGINTALVPDAAKRPKNFKEFWDVAQFPGTRILQSGQLGDEGPWEEALLADGVDPQKLYPMDIDRIFSSLDKIKPSIRRWWTVGSEPMQLFGGGQIAFGTSPDGRILALKDAGKPLEIEYHGATFTGIFWAIPKKAPNPDLAQQFIAFAMKAQPQAEVAKLTHFAPVNENAFKLIDDGLARTLISYPANIRNAVRIEGEWYGAVGSDGKTNAQKLIDRWNQWILR